MLPSESTVVMEVLDKVPLVVPVRVALGWRLLSPKVTDVSLLSLMCLCPGGPGAGGPGVEAAVA